MRKVTRRLRGLTPRQLFVIVAAAVLTGGALLAAALDLLALAVAALVLVNLLALTVALQIRRRLDQGMRRVHHDVKALHGAHTRLDQRTEAAQRRILAAVENERLEAAERQQVLLGLLRQDDAEATARRG